jgi:hypothetical protein
MWSDIGSPQLNKRDFGFRFSIKRESSSKKFIIKIGLDWDQGQTHFYIPLQNTPFIKGPIQTNEFETMDNAMIAYKTLRNWMETIYYKQPNSANFINDKNNWKAENSKDLY